MIEPAIARSNGVGVARWAQRPNAAALLYECWLSEAQPLMFAMDYVPSNRKVKSPLSNIRIRLIDPVLAPDQADKWTATFHDVVIKRNK